MLGLATVGCHSFPVAVPNRCQSAHTDAKPGYDNAPTTPY